LETAIRGSNAQYDDPDILQRVDVRTLEVSPGDSGWDVFSLDYHVDSPINTILTPVAMKEYLKMSNFLWRLKRVEHALSSAWRRQTTSARMIRPILGMCVRELRFGRVEEHHWELGLIMCFPWYVVHPRGPFGRTLAIFALP